MLVNINKLDYCQLFLKKNKSFNVLADMFFFLEPKFCGLMWLGRWPIQLLIKYRKETCTQGIQIPGSCDMTKSTRWICNYI
jgi:hypothetical protein